MNDTIGALLPHSAPELLLMDVDGTLTEATSQVVAEPTAELVQRLKANMHIALCTGRYLESTRQLAQQLGLTAPQISENGARIFHPATGEVLYRSLIPREMYQDLVQLIRGYSPFYVCINDQTVLDSERLTVSDADEITAITVGFRGGASAEPLITRLQAQFALSVTTTSERSDMRFVVITNTDVDKGTATRRLLQLLGASAERTIAVGDGDNDIPMFRAVGLSVAMGNASAAVKAAATLTTGAQPDGGLDELLTALSRRYLD